MRSLSLLSMALGAVLLAQPPSPTLANSAYDYHVGDELVVLTPDTGQLLVKFRDDAEISDLVQRGNVASFDPFDLDIVTLEGTSLSASGLAARSDVDFVAPVLRTKRGNPVYWGNRLSVRFTETASASRRADILASVNPDTAVPARFDADRYDLTVPWTRATEVFDLARHLETYPEVQYALPDLSLTYDFSYTPSDPLFSQQWHLLNIQADDAWDLVRGESNVAIAILDTGVDILHPDLADAILYPYDFEDDDYDPSPDCSMPNHGHGTACAGLAAALGDNFRGVAGVAYGVRIVPIRLGPSASTGADAIDYASFHANILSMSWSVDPETPGIAQALVNARLNGDVLVAAAGQDSVAVRFPANLPDVIAVGATTQTGDPIENCNFGPALELMAPGIDLVTTDVRGDCGYTQGAPWEEADYVLGFGGTSGATPQVAGAAALLLTANPNLTYDQVREVLNGTAWPTGDNNPEHVGHGLLDVRAALEAVTQDFEVQVLSPNGGETPTIGDSVTIRWASCLYCQPRFDVYLSRNAGFSWEPLYLQLSPVLRSVTWTVGGPPSAQCLVRVVATGDLATDEDVSDTVFEILDDYVPPPLQILQPESVDYVFVGDDVPFVWAVDDAANYSAISIELKIGTGSWNAIHTAGPSETTWTWTVGGNQVSNARLRVRATRVAGGSEIVEVPGSFTIFDDYFQDVAQDGSQEYTRIQNAIDEAISGMTVRVWPGTYSEWTWVNQHDPAQGTTCVNMRSADVISVGGPDVTIIDGFAASTAGGSDGSYTVNFTGYSSTIEGFKIIRAGRAGIRFNHSHGTARNNVIHAGTTGIRFDDHSEATAIGNILWLQELHGMKTDTFSNPVITENVLYGYSLFGLHFDIGVLTESTTGGAIVRNNTITGKGLALTVRDHPEDTYSHNIIYDNTNGVDFQASTSIPFECNDVFDNHDAYLQDDRTGVDGNFAKDPLFCDAAAGNFGLRANSPCSEVYSTCGERIGAGLVTCEAEAPSVVQMVGFETGTLDRAASVVGSPQVIAAGAHSGRSALHVTESGPCAVRVGRSGNADGDETALGLTEVQVSLYLHTAIDPFSETVPIVGLAGGSGTLAEIRMRPDGDVELWAAGTQIGGALDVFANYFLLDLVWRAESSPGAGDGYVELWRNGYRLAGGYQLATGTDPADWLVLGHESAGDASDAYRFDDVVILDRPWHHMGHSLQVLAPNSNGSYSEWNAMGFNHSYFVDDYASAATYDTNTLVTTGGSLSHPRETFHVASPSAVGIGPDDPIGAVAPIAIVEDNAALTRGRLMCKLGVVETESGSNIDFPVGFGVLARVEGRNLLTGEPWIGEDLEDLEVGLVDYTATGHQLRCTAVALLVMDVEYDNTFILGQTAQAPAAESGLDRSVSELPSSGFVSFGPNPARSRCTVQFAVRNSGPVSLTVYDVTGRVVRRLVDEAMEPGLYSAAWDLENSNRERVSPGVYFYRLTLGAEQETRKVVTVQ
ncbi:MAG: S8 family serine peptidase [bacterium]